MQSTNNDPVMNALSTGKTCPESSPTKPTHSGVSWDYSPGKLSSFSRQGAGAGRTLVVCMAPKEQSRGGFSMPNISEWPNDAAVCFLSQVLETGSIPLNFFLSPTACAGILRRAARRGKKLPELLRVALVAAARMVSFGEYVDDGTASTCKARDYKDATDLVYALQDDTTPKFSAGRNSALRADSGGAGPCVAYGIPGNWIGRKPENGGNAVRPMYNVAPCLTGADRHGVAHVEVMPPQVRRLTPRECERLQGFPDDYTLVPVRGKPAADGPRYKALGNSMAVPCMRWLGVRLLLTHPALTHYHKQQLQTEN